MGPLSTQGGGSRACRGKTCRSPPLHDQGRGAGAGPAVAGPAALVVKGGGGVGGVPVSFFELLNGFRGVSLKLLVRSAFLSVWVWGGVCVCVWAGNC